MRTIDAAPKAVFDALPADGQQKLLEMRATLGRLPGAAAEGAAGSIAHKADAFSPITLASASTSRRRGDYLMSVARHLTNC